MLSSGGPRGAGRAPEVPGRTAPGETDEPAELVALDDLDDADVADASTRRLTQQIARRLSLARPRDSEMTSRGSGERTSVRWRGGSDEIDLDATLESIAGIPFPEDDDVMVHEWLRRRRSVVLVVDVSGSMSGERIRTAAATVGALTGELSGDQLAVIAFWSDAAVLVPLGELVEPLGVLDLLLRIPARGLTNVSFALETAARQLEEVPRRDARVLLLSDGVHNAGPDPRLAASRLPRLDVLLDVSGEKDIDLGRDLARAGRGQCRLVRSHRDVPGALQGIFGD